MKNCSHCKKKPVKARGLCGACYSRWQRNGKLEYVKIINYCRIDDCGGRVVSNGYCQKHNARIKRHGSPAQTRPHTWGMKSKHPLYGVWGWTKRGVIGRDGQWDDFWRFVADVGEKPNKRSWLMRKNSGIKYGPENFYWTEPAADRSLAEISSAEYQKKWRKNNPRAAKNNDLRRYGITIEYYEKMLTEQDGTCAICDNKDDHFSLAVDHDHDTGVVRGLLCSQCNRGLGLFKDDIERLRKAVYYMTEHKPPTAGL